jgi:hypothetical protein
MKKLGLRYTCLVVSFPFAMLLASASLLFICLVFTVCGEKRLRASCTL